MTDVQPTAWVDKLALTELVTKYFQLVDDKDFAVEQLQAIFTDDGSVTRPNDAVIAGPAAIAESNSKSFARFRATQHLPGGFVIELDGDQAAVHVNVMAMHLWADGFGDPNALDKHFVGGVVIEASARRTASGWRLTNLRDETYGGVGRALGQCCRPFKAENPRRNTYSQKWAGGAEARIRLCTRAVANSLGRRHCT